MVAIKKTQNADLDPELEDIDFEDLIRNDPDAIPGVHFMTEEEALALFDEEAQRYLGISGKDFVRRWDAGEIGPLPDTREYWKLGGLVMMLPLARRAYR